MVLQKRTLRLICAASITATAALYIGSPYVALWSMGWALKHHDDAELRTVLDWGQVRDGFKQSVGVSSGPSAGVPISQQRDELPGFGESFASGVASRTIDADITPQRLDAMLSAPMLRQQASGGLLHGAFHGPAGFEAEVRMRDEPPIEISMQIEKWHWKITRIRVPQDLLTGSAKAPSGRV